MQKFLERDFNQCFQQLRDYSQQMWDITKFTFTAYASLLGIALGAYKLAAEQNVDLKIPVTAALGAGSLVGFFMFGLLTRNRVYFVTIARYINSHRKHFFDISPESTRFARGFYDNPNYPKFVNVFSSHAFISYIVAALNSILVVTILLLYLWNHKNIPTISITAVVGSFLLQVVPALIYLRSRENKSANRAVFGDSTRSRVIEHGS